MTVVKYRSLHPNLHPRRTKIEVPGWAGKPEPRADGSHEYKVWNAVKEAGKVPIKELAVCAPRNHTRKSCD